MDRLPPNRAATRTLAQHREARDLRTVVVDALAAAPSDEQSLRAGVWTYVRGEREVGVAPGVVILALTDMVDRAKIVPDTARIARTRDVILWCVEAYFGQLGGEAFGSERGVAGPESADEPAEDTAGTSR
ncbi:MAG: hypothetical protein JF589_06305 [Gemmatimonadetes bacterium]|jgi:hypothetical protein|nr:hypothetical protein [Gemmatimonadota bacterium]